MGGRPAVCIGHGAPGVCALGATGLLPPGVLFAICPGDGEATPVRCPGGAGDVCTRAEPAEEGEGDVARTVAGELAGKDGGLDTAAPWAAAEGEAACDGELEAAPP